MNSIFILRSFAIILISVLLTTCEKEKKDLPMDGDGNIYDTIVIGTQTWLNSNLKTTKYNNGTPIPLVTENDKWSTSTTHAYCWYNNDIRMAKEIYGALYNWYAATKNICPEGWHVPTLDDWNTLIDYLGGENVAGGKLKEAGSTHWIYPNNGATNESGFTACPGGERNRYGEYSGLGNTSIWWTSSPGYEIYGWRLFINNGRSNIVTTAFPKEVGFSIRCVKDY